MLGLDLGSRYSVIDVLGNDSPLSRLAVPSAALELTGNGHRLFRRDGEPGIDDSVSGHGRMLEAPTDIFGRRWGPHAAGHPLSSQCRFSVLACAPHEVVRWITKPSYRFACHWPSPVGSSPIWAVGSSV